MGDGTMTTDRPDTDALPHAGPSDADLVHATLADPTRFADLYGRYFDLVFAYCLRRLDDPTVAEDAAAAIFSRAFAAIGSCRQPERFRPWLFTIAHHEVTDRYRAGRPVTDLDAVAHTLRDPDRSPEEQAIAADEGRALRRAVAALPDDQRHVIELRLAGLSGPEMAAVMGRRHGAIRALQHRAFQRLRDLLGPPPDESTTVPSAPASSRTDRPGTGATS